MDGYQRIAINLCSGNIKRTDVDLKNTSVEERLGGVSRGINAVGQQLFNHSDLDDAYASCLEICGTWTTEERLCTARTTISRPNDCAAQTACLLPAVREMMK